MVQLSNSGRQRLSLDRVNEREKSCPRRPEHFAFGDTELEPIRRLASFSWRVIFSAKTTVSDMNITLGAHVAESIKVVALPILPPASAGDDPSWVGVSAGAP